MIKILHGFLMILFCSASLLQGSDEYGKVIATVCDSNDRAFEEDGQAAALRSYTQAQQKKQQENQLKIEKKAFEAFGKKYNEEKEIRSKYMSFYRQALLKIDTATNQTIPIQLEVMRSIVREERVLKKSYRSSCYPDSRYPENLEAATIDRSEYDMDYMLATPVWWCSCKEFQGVFRSPEYCCWPTQHKPDDVTNNVNIMQKNITRIISRIDCMDRSWKSHAECNGYLQSNEQQINSGKVVAVAEPIIIAEVDVCVIQDRF